MKNPKYYIVCEYNDYNQALDYALENLLGRESSGSGFGFGGRDISFDFYRIDAVKRARKKLKKFKPSKFGVTKLTFKFYEYEQD